MCTFQAVLNDVYFPSRNSTMCCCYIAGTNTSLIHFCYIAGTNTSLIPYGTRQERATLSFQMSNPRISRNDFFLLQPDKPYTRTTWNKILDDLLKEMVEGDEDQIKSVLERFIYIFHHDLLPEKLMEKTYDSILFNFRHIIQNGKKFQS